MCNRVACGARLTIPYHTYIDMYIQAFVHTHVSGAPTRTQAQSHSIYIVSVAKVHSIFVCFVPRHGRSPGDVP